MEMKIMRPIDADELKITLTDWIRLHWDEAFTADDMAYAFLEMINEELTLKMKPVVPAHWIDQGHKIFKCSNCGNYLDFRGVNAGGGAANYCPNCGAKMWNILTRKPQKLTKREKEIRTYIVDEYGKSLYAVEVHNTPETVAREDEASKNT